MADVGGGSQREIYRDRAAKAAVIEGIGASAAIERAAQAAGTGEVELIVGTAAVQVLESAEDQHLARNGDAVNRAQCVDRGGVHAREGIRAGSGTDQGIDAGKSAADDAGSAAEASRIRAGQDHAARAGVTRQAERVIASAAVNAAREDGIVGKVEGIIAFRATQIEGLAAADIEDIRRTAADENFDRVEAKGMRAIDVLVGAVEIPGGIHVAAGQAIRASSGAHKGIQVGEGPAQAGFGAAEAIDAAQIGQDHAARTGISTQIEYIAARTAVQIPGEGGRAAEDEAVTAAAAAQGLEVLVGQTAPGGRVLAGRDRPGSCAIHTGQAVTAQPGSNQGFDIAESRTVDRAIEAIQAAQRRKDKLERAEGRAEIHGIGTGAAGKGTAEAGARREDKAVIATIASQQIDAAAGIDDVIVIIPGQDIIVGAAQNVFDAADRTADCCRRAAQQIDNYTTGITAVVDPIDPSAASEAAAQAAAGDQAEAICTAAACQILQSAESVSIGQAAVYARDHKDRAAVRANECVTGSGTHQGLDTTETSRQASCGQSIQRNGDRAGITRVTQGIAARAATERTAQTAGRNEVEEIRTRRANQILEAGKGQAIHAAAVGTADDEAAARVACQDGIAERRTDDGLNAGEGNQTGSRARLHIQGNSRRISTVIQGIRTRAANEIFDGSKGEAAAQGTGSHTGHVEGSAAICRGNAICARSGTYQPFDAGESTHQTGQGHGLQVEVDRRCVSAVINPIST